MPQWFHPENEVKYIIKGTLERIQPVGAIWDIATIVDFVYLHGAPPTEVSNALSRADLNMFIYGVNTLINCGCSGARANLVQALRLFDTIKTVNALTDGAKQMLDNASVAIKQFTAKRLSKD
jgi:hypothetical protein